MMAQDLRAPALVRVAERADLFDLVALAADDRLVEKDPGFFGTLSQVDVAYRLLSSQELVVGIAMAQPEQHAVVATLVEPLITGHKELADPIERIVLRPR